MGRKLVSVDDDLRFPDPIEARLAADAAAAGEAAVGDVVDTATAAAQTASAAAAAAQAVGATTDAQMRARALATPTSDNFAGALSASTARAIADDDDFDGTAHEATEELITDGIALTTPPLTRRVTKPAAAPRATWLAASATLSYQNSAGITRSGTTIGATTGGTEGRVWQARTNDLVRMSATIKVTKATSGSYSMVGVSATAFGQDPGAPGGGADSLAVGYIQGVGIVSRRAAAPGADRVLVADSALTDGDLVPVTYEFDKLIHTTGYSAGLLIRVTALNADGTIRAKGADGWQIGYWSNLDVIVARTNVAASIVDWRVSQAPNGSIANQVTAAGQCYFSPDSAEQMGLLTPPVSNGKLVIACHGRGGNPYDYVQAAQFTPTWDALLRAGYTIAIPALGGDKWANNTVMDMLGHLVTTVCGALNLDTRVLVWAYSMGGLAAWRAISLGVLDAAAVYSAAAVLDLTTMDTGSYPEIATLYPTVGARQAVSPVNLAPSTFAGVEYATFVTMGADGAVTPSSNTVAFRTHLGSVVASRYIGYAAGAHDDPSLWQADLTLATFQRAG